MRTSEWLSLALALLFAVGTPGFVTEANAAKKKAAVSKKKPKAKKKVKRKSKKKASISRTKAAKTFLVNQLLEQGVVGVRVGFDVSSMDCDCDTEVDYSGSLGFLAGLSYDKSFTRHFGYRGHAGYLTKSYDYETIGDGSVELERSTELAQIKLGGDVTLRYDVNKLVTVYLIGGPFLAFNTSVRSRTNGQRDKDEADSFSIFDYGFTFGAGGYFAISKKRGLMASAELTYSNGLADRIDREGTSDEDDIEESGLVNLIAGIHF